MRFGNFAGSSLLTGCVPVWKMVGLGKPVIFIGVWGLTPLGGLRKSKDAVLSFFQ